MTDQTGAEIVRRLREKRGVLDNQWPGPSELELQAAALIEALSAEKAGPAAELANACLAVDVEYAKNIEWARGHLVDMREKSAMERRALAAESTVARLTGEKEIETQKREFAEFEWKRSDERAAAAEARLAEAAQNFRAIKQATVDGRVCDDVAWFDAITTLHDFCELAAINCAVGGS